MAKVRTPVRRFDLVVDQLVDRVGIWHPQERFGQTHEAHALFGRKTVFGKKCLHHRGRGFAAHPFDILRACFGDGLAFRLREVNALQQPLDRVGFADLVLRADVLARGIGAAGKFGFKFRHICSPSVTRAALWQGHAHVRRGSDRCPTPQQCDFRPVSERGLLTIVGSGGPSAACDA